MNAITSCNKDNIKNVDENILGKKIKRFKNRLKYRTGIADSYIPPPPLSKSTLAQIEKIMQNKKNSKKDENFPSNKDMPPKFKLPELSLKEQYQDLLNRKELILPPKYRLLLKKQNYLDDLLSDNKENISHSYQIIQNNFNKKMNMNFNNKDFQQILFISPFYYIYQSIKKISKGIELQFIDIPKDYIQRMNKKYNLKTNFTLLQAPKMYEPAKGEMNKAVMEKRKKLFKKILLNLTLEQHQKFLKENNIDNFDPIKSRTWHHKFDLKNINDIGVYNLVENNIKEYKKLLII
jgi:hypothetical protein